MRHKTQSFATRQCQIAVYEELSRELAISVPNIPLEIIEERARFAPGVEALKFCQRRVGRDEDPVGGGVIVADRLHPEKALPLNQLSPVKFKADISVN
jgi:hypothetical protein